MPTIEVFATEKDHPYIGFYKQLSNGGIQYSGHVFQLDGKRYLSLYVGQGEGVNIEVDNPSVVADDPYGHPDFYPGGPIGHGVITYGPGEGWAEDRHRTEQAARGWPCSMCRTKTGSRDALISHNATCPEVAAFYKECGCDDS